MKLFVPLLSAVAFAGSSSASVIAFWDFNNGYAAPDPSEQIVHMAAAGSGAIYQQQAQIDLNGKDGNAFQDAGNLIDVMPGQSMAWNDVDTKSAGQAECFVTFSTFNFTDIVVSFDISGNKDKGIASFDLKYAATALADIANPNGTQTIKDFAGGISTSLLNNEPVAAPADKTFIRVSLNLSALSGGAIDGRNFVAIRFDDWKSNDALSIDNLLVTGSAVPEPASVLLGMLGGVASLRRRR